MSNLYLILIIAALVLAGALFSGAETGIYRLSRFRLRLGLTERRKRFDVLHTLMADSRGLIFSILISNNIANYAATSLLTWYFVRSHDTAAHAELYAALIMVPTLFVVADLLPKNLFYYLADSLMPRIALLVLVMHRLLTWCGVVGLLKFCASGVAVIARSPAPEIAGQRQYIRQIIQDTREEGMLSAIQVDIIERLINIPSVSLSAVMVPLTGVRMIPIATDRASLAAVLAATHFRHLPVYKLSRTEIVGLIDMYEVLHSSADFTSVEAFSTPIRRVSADTRIIEAINLMRNEHLEMILVCRFDRAGHAIPIGIATMKDLVEELIGELAQW